MTPYPVEIEWADSTFLRGWKRKQDFEDLRPDVCYSVGFLVAKTDDVVTIVQSISGGEMADGITIPRRMVRRIRRLQVK